jgi:hypothetical protein
LKAVCGFGERFVDIEGGLWALQEVCGFWERMARGGEKRMVGNVGYVGLLVGLLLVGDLWSVVAAPANFDVREHISSSTR